MIKWNLSLLLLVLFTGAAVAEESMIVRFNMTESMREYLRANEFDITGVNYKTNEIEALLTPSELERIKSQKAVVSFSFPQTLAIAPDKEYKNPEEIEAYVKDIHVRFPELTELRDIGKTLEGRSIWAIKITGNNDKAQKPVFFVNGMHHAREVMTPEITTDMVEYLTSRYSNDESVTKWLDNTVVWVIPMFNLDGNNKMWNDDSMWRKNTRNGHGVDINRNYPTAWNTCRGSSGSTWSQDFRGPSAGSEPETQAMMNFVGSIKPVFSISYHSYSEIVIYPFGCKPKRTPAFEAIESIGADLGAKLDYKPGTAWELLYNVDGGDIDYMYTEHQVLPYVIEVNSTGEGFHPSYAKWRDKTVQRNRAGWMHLLDRLDGASLQGKVTLGDYSTIKISKSGDLAPSQTYKINPDGSFYVILKPGTYDFAFEGTKSKMVTGMSITTKQVINL
ncbi:MAG TPA: M14 family zinc carboxypeptidase [Bacteriovoracaceae bacterium]|nr:M14 family zinc carboxypeptidase [Bacteriovoracaceae bacterium]